MGHIYVRRRSRFLWIKYHQNGRVIRESTGTTNRAKARRMLRVREGDVERGVPIEPKAGRIFFEDAATDLLNDYRPTVGAPSRTPRAESTNTCSHFSRTDE